MSPEQANGQELDTRSDLISLGSVMYAMCAGRAAFEAESAIAIVRQVADKPAPPLRDFRLETPDWLIETIDKLMAKSPEDRFQSAGELAELLGGHLQDEHSGSSNLASTPIAAPRSIRQRHLAVSLCALLLIVPLGFWLTQVVFRVETPHGTLVVRTDDPDVQISVKSAGTEVALFFPRQKKKNPLKVGEYTIELVKAKKGLKLSTNKFEIQSGQDQKTVMVEFEPALASAKDPSPGKEPAQGADQVAASDVEQPFAWPEGPLWNGRVAAPDLSQAKELYRDDFADLHTTWPIVKLAGREYGRDQGMYFISADPGLVGSAGLEDQAYANYACQVVGRVKSKGTQWYLNYTSLAKQVTVRVHLNGLQAVEVSILNDGPPRVAQRIRHTALKKDEEFNKLLVVALGNRVELFVNDLAICDPIVLDEITPPGYFALGAVANHIPVRAEFKSFTIWSAEGLSTAEERLAGGVPYNLPPAPAKPN